MLLIWIFYPFLFNLLFINLDYLPEKNHSLFYRLCVCVLTHRCSHTHSYCTSMYNSILLGCSHSMFWDKVYHFCLKFTELARSACQRLPRPLHFHFPHIRMASTYPHAQYFYVAPVDFTQVLLLSWWALYWLSHIPSSVLLILCIVPLTSISLIFMLIFIGSFCRLNWIWPLLVFLRSSDASLSYWLIFGYIFNINISNHTFPS